MRKRVQSGDSEWLRPLYVAYRARQLYSDEWPFTAGEEVVLAFLGDIDRAFRKDASCPAFAWTHLMDLHTPIHLNTVSKGGLVDRQWLGSFTTLWRDSARMLGRQCPSYGFVYDSAIRYVDRQIGRIIDTLKARDVWNDTVFVVTADHGEALFGRGVYDHPPNFLFDELLHVPLLVRVPSTDDDSEKHDEIEACRLDHPFSLAWLHELLAEIPGVGSTPLEQPEPSGRSMHFDDTAAEWSPVISDGIGTHGHTVAMRDGQYKFLTRFGDGPPPGQDENVARYVRAIADGVLFNYRLNTNERNPGVGDGPIQLRSAVDRHQTSPSNLLHVDRTIENETKRLLEDLGYLN